MPTLKNTSGGAIYLGANGKRIEDGATVSVDGDIDKDNSPDDAYLIGDRLWPKATWTATGGRSSSDPDVTSEEN